MKHMTLTATALLLPALVAPAFAGIASREYLTYDVGDYVQDGLVLHYDGIRNAGADQPHSTDALQWVNLAGNGYTLSGYRWVYNEGETRPYTRSDDAPSGTWNESNGFAFDGKGGFAVTQSLSMPPSYTIQLAMTASAADQVKGWNQYSVGYIFRPKDYASGSICIRSSQNGSVTPANAVYTIDATRFGSNSIRPNFANANPRYATVIGTATNLCCFEGTATPTSTAGDGSCVDGARDSNFANNWFAIGSQYDGSPRASDGVQGFVGTLHSVRYYSRPLTEEELAWNRTVDDARFFGARTPIATTNVVVASSHSFLHGAEREGYYEISGSHTFTAPATASHKGMTYECAGYTIETWDSANQFWSDPVSYASTSYACTASAIPVRLTWQWKAVSGIRSASDYDIDDYAAAGLVLNYDGIRNVAAFSDHSDSTPIWNNLAPGYADMPMFWTSYKGDSVRITKGDTTHGSWNAGSGFEFDGQEIFVFGDEPDSPKFALPPAYTFQLTLDAAMADQTANQKIAYLFSAKYENDAWEHGSIAMRGEKNGDIHAANALYTVDKMRFNGTGTRPNFINAHPRYATILGTTTNLCCFEGTEIPTGGTECKSGALSTTRLYNWFAIGGRYFSGGSATASVQGLHGTLHAVRFYDRPLTEDEIARNREADSARFFGALATTNVVVEVADGSGIVSTPAAGFYKVEGEGVFTASRNNSTAFGYKLWDWDEANGEWTNPRSVSADSFTFNAETATAAKQRIVWVEIKPTVLMMR